MKWFVYGLAVVLVLAGAVFALQGLRLLPSQVMYGRPEWIVIGAAMVVAGGIIGVWTTVRSRQKAAEPPAP